MKKPCSERFERIFSSGSGGIVRTCACGITTFSTQRCDKGCYEPGELADLESKADTYPDKFKGVDYTVSTMMINGNEVVDGCTCDIARQYEDFIIHSARQIAAYLNEFAKELRKRADDIEVPR